MAVKIASLGIVCVILAFASAQAQTNGTWTGGTGNYSNSANWSSGNIASGTGAAMTISSPTGTITLDSNYTVGSIAMSASGPHWIETLTGSSPSNILTFSTSSGTPSITTANYYQSTFYWGNMKLAGNQGINFTSGYNTIVLQTGMSWTMTGTLQFVVNATHDENNLYAQGNNVLPTTMDLNVNSQNGSLLVINGGTTQTIGSLTGISGDYIAAWSGSNGLHGTVSGTNVLGSTSLATLVIGNTNNSGTFSGIIGQSFAGDTSADAAGLSITKVGTGTETLSGLNTYSGTTTVNAGTLQLGISGALPSTTAVTLNGSGLLDLNGFNNTIAGLNGSGTVDNVAGTAASTLTISSSGSFSGAIQNTSNVVNLNITGGTQTLTGVSSYSGTTTVGGGTLQIGSGGRLSNTSTVTVNSGGSLLFGTSSATPSKPTTNLNGGTVGFSSGLGNNSIALGALSLSVSSGIDFGSGRSGANNNTLTFSSLSNLSGGVVLTITDYLASGVYALGATADNGLNQDRLILNSEYGTSLGTQLSQIVFYNTSGQQIGFGEEVSYGAGFEIVPVTTPEPTSLLNALGFFCLLVWGGRHQIIKCSRKLGRI